MNRKKAFALTRILAAVIAAVILTACTGFAFADLIRGPEEVTNGTELETGTYVATDVSYLMNICGVERRESDDEPVAYFAITPMGEQFVVIRFPASEYDTIAAMEAETQAFLSGDKTAVTFRVRVTGAARTINDEAAELLEQWFLNYAEWMSQAGMIVATENYSDYLCGVMIDAGGVGSVSNTAAITLTVIAAVLVLYAITETVILCAGGRIQKKKDGKEDA